MAEGTIGKGILQVGFDPTQVAQAGKEQLLPGVRGLAQDAAGVFAAAKIFNIGREGLDELKQQQAAAAQTSAVIASTGGAAGVTSGHVDELSQSLLKLSGTDDEVIKGGENVLLGFTNIQNRLGAGHDTFDRATKDALDLSVRFGGDMAGSAKILGLALEDPEKGMTRLRRAGVILDDQQKQSIKTFQDHGDIVDAQGVILDAVEKKVGGAAKAYGETLPGQLAIANESLKNTKAELVAGMAPALQLGAESVTFLTDEFDKLPAPARTVVGSLALVGGGAVALVRPVRDAVDLYSRWSARAKDVADAEEGVAAAQEASTVAATSSATASDEVAAADIRRIVAGDQLKFSDAEVATALEARDVAAAQAVVGNDALIAADEELVAADGEVAAAGEAASASLGPIGIALAVVAAAAAAFGLASSQATAGSRELDTQLQQLSGTFDKLGHDTSTVTTDYATFLDNLVKSKDVGPGLIKVLNDTGVTTAQLADKIALGTQGYKTWVDTQVSAGHINVVTGQELLDLGNKMQGQAQKALDAAVAQGVLTAAQRDGAEAANHNADGSVNFSGALQSLAPILGQTKAGVDDLGNATMDPVAESAKEVADRFARVKTEADTAYAAVLRFAPADIRVQQGNLSIADDKARLADAQQKLNDAQKGGYGPAILQAQRDLATAQLSLTSAINDQATALADQKKAQDEANGVTETARQYDENYLLSLQGLAGGITGPVHDAIGVYIYDVGAAVSQTDRLKAAQLGLYSIDQLIDPNYYGGANDTGTRSGGPVVARAGGGDVNSPFLAAEDGFEILWKKGIYPPPPGGGWVMPHAQSEQYLAAAMAGTRGSGGAGDTHIHGDIVLQGSDSREALKLLPTELAVRRYLAPR